MYAGKRDSVISVGFKRVSKRLPCRICGNPLIRKGAALHSSSVVIQRAPRPASLVSAHVPLFAGTLLRGGTLRSAFYF